MQWSGPILQILHCTGIEKLPCEDQRPSLSPQRTFQQVLERKGLERRSCNARSMARACLHIGQFYKFCNVMGSGKKLSCESRVTARFEGLSKFPPMKLRHGLGRTGVERKLLYAGQVSSPTEGQKFMHSFINDHFTNPLMYSSPEEAAMRGPMPKFQRGG